MTLDVDEWIKNNPDLANQIMADVHERETWTKLGKAFPTTYSLLARCEDDLAEKIVACLQQHEIDIVYPRLAELLDFQTRRELSNLLEKLRTKPS